MGAKAILASILTVAGILAAIAAVYPPLKDFFIHWGTRLVENWNYYVLPRLIGFANWVPTAFSGIQQNWQALSIAAGVGFTVGVPIFRWLYGRYKQRAQEALDRKQVALDVMEEKKELYRTQFEDLREKSTAAITSATGKAEEFKSQYEKLSEQSKNWDIALQRVTDQRNYVQALYDDLKKKYDAVAKPPLVD